MIDWAVETPEMISSVPVVLVGCSRQELTLFISWEIIISQWKRLFIYFILILIVSSKLLYYFELMRYISITIL